MNISIKGYGENTATFATDGVVCASHVVKLSDNLTVCRCDDGDFFAGVVVNVKSGYACVQLDGYVTVNYSGDAPSVGYCALVTDDSGGVYADEAGREYLITDIDKTNKTIGIIL